MTTERTQRRVLPVLPPRIARVRAVAAVVLSGLLGAWVAVLLFGTHQALAGPLEVEASVRPGWPGESVVQINPVGSIAADTHTAPFRLTVDVVAVDADGVRGLVETPDQLADLDEQLLGDLEGILVATVVQTVAVAVVGGVVGGLLVTRSVRRAAFAGVTVVVVLVASAGVAAATFDSRALLEPRFDGLLQNAPNVVGSAETIAANFDAYAQQLAGLVTNVSTLYDAALTLPTFAPDDQTIRLLHVSDLHLNPAAWDVISAVADQYDVAAVLDTGDIADHGTALENAYVAPISTLDRPYVFVKGNHDSLGTVAAVAAQDNAVVLDDDTVEIAGVTILGGADPRFTPDQATRETASQDLLEATEQTAETARSLPGPPDVVMFHDATNSELFADTTPLVLSGHTHRRNSFVVGDATRVLIEGSTGGAGLRALEGEEPTPVMMSVLYLDAESQELVAWDELTLGGLGLSRAEIQRVRPDSLGPAEQQPDPTPVSTPTAVQGLASPGAERRR